MMVHNMKNPELRGPLMAPVNYESEQGLEEELRLEAEQVFEHLVASSIGEGESGIVVNFGNPKYAGFCLKYHKIEYKPQEFRNLQLAFAAGKQVPKPIVEIPEKHGFIMERVKEAKTLKELKDLGYKFTSEIMDEVREISMDFCKHFTHNDFFERNIMLENVLVEDGIVTEGTPIIIDLERMEVGKSDEYQRVRSWFRNCMATS